MSFSDPDYWLYESLRSTLYDVQCEFTQAASHFPELVHRRFSVPGQRLSQESWMAFINVNSGKVENTDWEYWEPYPDGNYCSQFFGNKTGFRRFCRLAESGMHTLEEMRFRQTRGMFTPEEMQLSLPQEEGHFGWVSLLYDTAGESTALLRAHFHIWDAPPDADPEELDEMVDESWNETSNGVKFPAHPYYLELHLDLFRSSAEAIECWLAPENIICLAGRISESPICLPATDDLDDDEMDESLDPRASFDITSSEQESVAVEAKPRYDKDERTLYVGEEKIKTFTKPAENQERLLLTFQEEGWRVKIDDPLSPRPGSDSKKHLKDTIRALNQGLQVKDVIRFVGDGTGEAIKWEKV